MSVVLNGARYQKCFQDLILDPIVLDMYNQLKHVGIKANSVNQSSALKEYVRRGGKNAIYIGSVKEALIQLELVDNE